MPYRLLLFLSVINILNFFDRYLVQAVEPLLKVELGLSNQQSGLLGAAFVVGYCVCAPLFGFFSGRFDRRVLMAVGLVVWSLFTAVTGFATGFVSFFCARVLVGIGEASFGAIAPVYLKGRIADTVTLNSALSLFYVAIPVGSALGYVAGGLLASHFGWQAAFFLACVPGLLLSLGFLCVAPDQRSQAEGSKPSAEVGFVAGLIEILRSPVLALTIIGYIFNSFALNGVAMFVVRHVTTLGLDKDEASSIFGGVLAITGFIGALGGGALASRFAAQAKNPGYGLLLFVAVTTLIGTPCLGLAFCAATPMAFFAACFVAQIALFAGVAPLNTVLVSRAPKGLEALTQGVTIFLIQLLGAALAPVVIGWGADVLDRSGRGDVALSYALQIATLAMAISGFVWWRAAMTEKQRIGDAS
jgi:MFS family permease